MDHRYRNGFTLVELLVVVAIIVALLAILTPSMGRAVAMAQSAVCRSNLHQWGMVTINYASDHFSAYPLYTSDISPFQRLRGYWQVEPVKLCPTAPTPYSMPGLGGAILGGATYAMVEARFDTNGDGVRDHEVSSYTWNGMCNVQSAWPSPTSPAPHVPAAGYITRLSVADAKVPVMADGAWTAALPGATWFAGDQPDAAEWGPTSSSTHSWGLPRYALRRHPGKTINLGMADGHAANSPLPNLWSDFRWNRTWQIGQTAPNIPWL